MEPHPSLFTCPLCAGIATNIRLLYGVPVCGTCTHSFAWRRGFAWLIDRAAIAGLSIPFLMLFVFVYSPEGQGLFVSALLIILFSIFITALTAGFPLDFFKGYSPGKHAMGIRLMNFNSGTPAGFLTAFTRNILLIFTGNFLLIFVALQLKKGYRLGDGLAASKAIWVKYANTAPFATGSSAPGKSAFMQDVTLGKAFALALLILSGTLVGGIILIGLYGSTLTAEPSPETSRAVQRAARKPYKGDTGGNTVGTGATKENADQPVVETYEPYNLSYHLNRDAEKKQKADRLSFSRNGKHLVCTDFKEVTIWSVSAAGHWKCTAAFDHAFEVKYAELSPDNKYIAICERNTVHIRAMAGQGKWEQLEEFEGPGTKNTVTFSNDGTKLAAGSGPNVKIWTLTDDGRWELTTELPQSRYANQVNDIAFSPDGRYLAYGFNIPGSRNPLPTARVWRISADGDWEAADMLIGHKRHVTAVDFSPDSKVLATLSEDKIILWALSAEGTWEAATTIDENNYIDLAFAGEYLAYAKFRSGMQTVFGAIKPTGEWAEEKRFEGGSGNNCWAISPDLNYIVDSQFGIVIRVKSGEARERGTRVTAGYDREGRMLTGNFKGKGRMLDDKKWVEVPED